MVDTTILDRDTPRDVDSGRKLAAWPLGWNAAGVFAGAYALMLSITVALGFLITGPLSSTAIGEADNSVAQWFEGLRTTRWNGLTAIGSAFSDTITIVVALAVAIPLLVLITRRWKEAVLLTAAVALESLTFLTASLLVGRDRPPVDQLDASPPTASYPSGHTGAAFAFYVGLVVLVFWWTENRLARAAAVVVGGAIPVAVAVSRMYRGMHYLTDVTVGAVIGLVSLAVVAYLLRTRAREGAQA